MSLASIIRSVQCGVRVDYKFTIDDVNIYCPGVVTKIEAFYPQGYVEVDIAFDDGDSLRRTRLTMDTFVHSQFKASSLDEDDKAWTFSDGSLHDIITLKVGAWGQERATTRLAQAVAQTRTTGLVTLAYAAATLAVTVYLNRDVLGTTAAAAADVLSSGAVAIYAEVASRVEACVHAVLPSS